MKKTDEFKATVAFDAASKAVAKVLGPHPDQDCVCDIALLIAHAAITANEALDLILARRNAEIFCAQLTALVERTQQNKTSGTECGRLL